MKDLKKTQNIDDYIADFPEDTQHYLIELRTLINELLPDCTESISYNMPTFSMNGSYVVYFAGFKNHVGFYPAPVDTIEFAEELSKYKTGKGSVQFPLNKPMPVQLITRMVNYLLLENYKKTGKK